MNNWELDIPKILHVYWGTGWMPYLRLLTIETFMRYNPDWKIILWRPKYPADVITWNTKELQYENDWTECTYDVLSPPVEIRSVNFEKEYGISNKISEVHKSDYLRYKVLEKYGGVYSDMDILYFAPITELLVNKKENKDIETFVCICEYGHSNGFFMAKPGSHFFRRMSQLTEIIPDKYQSVGPDACNNFYPTIESINKISPAVNMGMEAVYSINGRHVPDIYAHIYPENASARFTKGSIGCHWYAGHKLSGEFLQKTNGGININNYRNLISMLINNFVKNPNKDMEYKKVNINEFINRHTRRSVNVVELGAGLFDKLQLVNKSVKELIGIEICKGYIDNTKYNGCIKIHGDINNYRELLKDYRKDTVMLIDVIEHMEMDDGFKLIQQLKNDFRKIIVIAPCGVFPQDEDVYGLNNEYQKHLSTWNGNDFRKLKFDINIIDPSFHKTKERIANKDDISAYFGVWEAKS